MKSIEKFDKLRHLELSLENNFIKMFGMTYLSQGLLRFPVLEVIKLNISNNEIDDNGLKELCNSLEKFKECK